MGNYLSQKIAAVQRLLLGISLTDWLVAGIVAKQTSGPVKAA